MPFNASQSPPRRADEAAQGQTRLDRLRPRPIQRIGQLLGLRMIDPDRGDAAEVS
jgi:hypothetical protein